MTTGATPFNARNAASETFLRSTDTAAKKSTGIGDAVGGMSDKVEGGILKFAGWFDKSRMRQYAFALIVMPAITLIAMRFILGADFFHIGFAALKHPGITQIMSIPILTVLAAGTAYGMISIFTKDMGEKKHNVVKRVMRVAALPLYLASYAFLIGFALKMQGGLAHSNYTHTATGIAASPGGLLTTAWPALLLLAGLPMGHFFKMFLEEADAFIEDCHKSEHLLLGRSQKDQLKMRKGHAEIYAESQMKASRAQEDEALRRAAITVEAATDPMNRRALLVGESEDARL